MTRMYRALIGLFIALLLVAAPVVQAQMTPAVEVSDQDIVNGTVTIDSVVSDGPGWIVIHADDNGSPGVVIGQSAVQDGENMDVEVEIDVDMATETLYAMLHIDAGVEGTYEFPGADSPATVDGEVVVASFMVTGGLEAAAEAEAETEAETEAEQQPETLPETGGSTVPWLPIVLVAVGLLVVVGAWLLSQRELEQVHIDK